MEILILTATFAFVTGLAFGAIITRPPPIRSPRSGTRPAVPPYSATGRRPASGLPDDTLTRFTEPGAGR